MNTDPNLNTIPNPMPNQPCQHSEMVALQNGGPTPNKPQQH